MATTVPTNTPLQQQIDEFIAEGASWLPTDLLQGLLSPIGQLINSGAAEQALKEGAQAPDFTLPDARGNAVTLSHLLTQGPVVMTFYRGQWCPYCHLVLRAYQQALPHMQARGATLVAISPQTPDHSRALAEKLELTFALLSDRGNQVARQCGLVFTIDEAVRGAHKHSLLKNSYMGELYLLHVLFSRSDFSRKMRTEETFSPFSTNWFIVRNKGL